MPFDVVNVHFSHFRGVSLQKWKQCITMFLYYCYNHHTSISNKVNGCLISSTFEIKLFWNGTISRLFTIIVCRTLISGFRGVGWNANSLPRAMKVIFYMNMAYKLQKLIKTYSENWCNLLESQLVIPIFSKIGNFLIFIELIAVFVNFFRQLKCPGRTKIWC